MDRSIDCSRAWYSSINLSITPSETKSLWNCLELWFLPLATRWYQNVAIHTPKTRQSTVWQRIKPNWNNSKLSDNNLLAIFIDVTFCFFVPHTVINSFLYEPSPVPCSVCLSVHLPVQCPVSSAVLHNYTTQPYHTLYGTADYQLNYLSPSQHAF